MLETFPPAGLFYDVIIRSRNHFQLFNPQYRRSFACCHVIIILSLTEEKLNLDQSDWEDIHVVTGALKLFFRELPEPLVPFGFFTDIVETVSK